MQNLSIIFKGEPNLSSDIFSSPIATESLPTPVHSHAWIHRTFQRVARPRNRSLHDARGASEAFVTRETATGSRPVPQGGKSGKRESRAAPTHARWSPVPTYTPERRTTSWMSHASVRVYEGGVRAAPGTAAYQGASPHRVLLLLPALAARHGLLTSGGTRARGTGPNVDVPGATSGTAAPIIDGGELAQKRACREERVQEDGRWMRFRRRSLYSWGRADVITTPLRTRARGVAASDPVKPQCAAVGYGIYYSNGRAGARGVSREEGRRIGSSARRDMRGACPASTGTFAVRVGGLGRESLTKLDPKKLATWGISDDQTDPLYLLQQLKKHIFFRNKESSKLVTATVAVEEAFNCITDILTQTLIDQSASGNAF
ncbi:hypothetical protein DFH09DRAFT_1432531 [Mycena vulgaris]|nr:hypothetical protein DFH09DRAFT_1432531 [Mycena vulgaris]